MSRRCEDCAANCTEVASWRVREIANDDDREWFYCDGHVPLLDPGVEVFPLEVESGSTPT